MFLELFFFFLLVEENLINGEVEEELKCRANHCCNILCCCFVAPFKAEEKVFESGVKPSREKDKCDCENYVDRKSNSDVCAGVEGLFFVNKESNNLSDDVCNVTNNKVT